MATGSGHSGGRSGALRDDDQGLEVRFRVGPAAGAALSSEPRVMASLQLGSRRRRPGLERPRCRLSSTGGSWRFRSVCSGDSTLDGFGASDSTLDGFRAGDSTLDGFGAGDSTLDGFSAAGGVVECGSVNSKVACGVLLFVTRKNTRLELLDRTPRPLNS